MKSRPKTSFEYSAGGVVTQDGKALLVQVENLQGDVLWTFPKGHVEPGEGPREAALREVEEETGYRCEIRGPLTVIRYFFMRENRRVRKQVRWYWMRPTSGPGPHDAEEVIRVQWMTFGAARDSLRYPGDFKLLEMVSERVRTGSHVKEIAK